MIHLSIDPNDPANKAENRKTNLEDNEFIDTFSVRLTDLWKECRKLESQGYAIDARVGTLAEGVELGKMLAGGKI